MNGLVILIHSLSLASGFRMVTSPLDSVPGSLRTTLESANPGDTIGFSIPGQDTLSIGAPLEIRKDLTLQGGSNAGTGKRVIIRLDSLVRGSPALKAVKGKVALRGVEIQGYVGIRSSADTLRLTDCVVTAREGRGVEVDSGVLVVDGGRFGRQAGSKAGGGLRIASRASVVLRGSTLAGNYSLEGGGAVQNSGTMEISGCEFADNSGSYGGAISNGGSMHVDRSVFRRNSAYGSKGERGNGSGGAISNGKTLVVENSLIDSNSCSGYSSSWGATAFGGGVFNAGQLKILACTLKRNKASAGGDHAQAHGGGLYNNGDILIDGCSFTGNLADARGDSFGGLASGGGVFNAREMLLENSLLTENASVGNPGDSYGGEATGGGITNTGHLNMVNSTIYKNSSRGHSGSSYGGKARSGGVDNSGYAGIIFSTIAGNWITAEDGDPHPGSQFADGIYNRDSMALVNTINFGSYTDSMTATGKARNVYARGGLPKDALGSLNNVTSFELFGKDEFGQEPLRLEDNGGPTLTIAIDSASIARGTGLPIGVCEVERKTDGSTWKLAIPVYFDGAEWKTVEKDSVVAAASVAPINTDQRGVVRQNPPGRGAFEYGKAPPSAVKQKEHSRTPAMRFVGFRDNRVEFFLPEAGDFQISLFDLQGRQVFSRGYLLEAGRQSIRLAGLTPGASYVLRVLGGKDPLAKSFLAR